MSDKLLMMNLRRARLLAFGLVLLSPAWASAALPEPAEPISNPDKPYVAYVIALVLVGALCAVAFKPSKRTHLD
jgi:hypothetical protein